MHLKRFSVPITKRNDDQQMVWGYASTPARDLDGDVITLEAMKGSLTEYMKFANIREMHEMKAVGVAKEAEVDEHGLYIGAKIVDPLAWLKVKEGVYKAFSIGGNATERAKGDPHTITGLQLIEISIVDRPANPEAVIDVFKSPALKEQPMNEDEARAELLKAVNALSGDALQAAVAALRKQVGTDTPDPAPEPVAKAADAPAAAAVPVQPVEAAPKRIARCLKAFGPGSSLAKAVAKAVDFKDAQFEGVLKLDTVALANWLGNNHGLLDAVEKAIPADSPLWENKKPLTFMVLPSEGDDALDLQKKDGDKPAGDYGDVEYADPGYQSDGKPRYPIDSEERIRAAWDYINKKKNQSKYSSDEVSKIKAKIVAAWKDKIDSEGPPSAESKAHSTKPNTETKVKKTNQTPDAKGDLRKGLMTACIALGLLDRLDGLQKSVAAEEAREQDGSTTPSRFMDVLKALSEVVKAYVNEEVAEMLSGETDSYDVGMPYPDYISYGDKAQELLKSLGWDGKAIADAMEGIIGDRTGAPGYTNLEKFASTELVKIKKSTPSGESGDWNGSGMPTEVMDMTQDWKQKAQSVHDMSVNMGASCDLHKGGKKCAACGAMNKADAEKCMKCEKAFGSKDDTDKSKKSAKANVAKGKKDDKGNGDDDDDEDDEDKGNEDDEDEENPKKPGKQKKKAASVDAGLDASAVAKLVADGIAASPLSKAVEELTGLLKGRTVNPPKPAPTKAITKGSDTPDDDKTAGEKKALSPGEVLKGIHSNPRFYRNE